MAPLKPFNLDAAVLESSRSAGGRLIYAIGDVHGRYDLLKVVLRQIVEDVRESAVAERPVLVFLGDYVDRGSQSAKVIEAVLWLQEQAELEVHALKGNHEAAMQAFLADPVGAPEWLRFGGLETLRAYGVGQRDLDDEGLTAMRDEAAQRIPARHRQFLADLELMHVVGDYAFVHAGVRPGTPLDQQAEHDLLWIRDEFLNSAEPFDKYIVHGHSAELAVQAMAHRLGVDTGAYATGVLTAARIDDDGTRLLQSGRMRPGLEALYA